MPAAIDPERLLRQFLDFVRIDSPSWEEAAFVSRLTRELEALGLRVENDRTGRDGAGNLLAVLPATDPALPAVLIATHTDTVEPGRGIRPRLEHGYLVSDGTTVLGADNKAAIAATLEASRYLQAAKPRHGDVELLYTWGEEELGLLGAAAFDARRLRAKFGFVADAGRLDKIITAGPYRTVFEATFLGQAAHAGGQIDRGINAIFAAAKAVAALPVGRVDEETTINIGTIAGGAGLNVVPERATLAGETRSFDEAKLERQVGLIRAALEAAAAAVGAKVEHRFERRYDGYRLPDEAPAVRVAHAALAALGVTAFTAASAGGNDAAWLTAKGVPCATLGTGYEQIHSTRERLPLSALAHTARLLVALVEETARRASDVT